MTRRTTLPLAALLALFALGLAAPAGASAASRDKIIQDCADDGRLQGKYTASELRDARQNLPSDVAEYTDCADVLRRAELPDRESAADGAASVPGAGGVSGGGGGAGEMLTPASDEERQALAEAAAEGAAPVEVDGETIVPGAAGFAPNATRNGIPGTLLLAIVALALLGVGGLAYALRDRMPDLGGLIPGRGAR